MAAAYSPIVASVVGDDAAWVRASAVAVATLTAPAACGGDVRDGGWACAKCTLRNTGAEDRCEACGTARAGSAAADVATPPLVLRPVSPQALSPGGAPSRVTSRMKQGLSDLGLPPGLVEVVSASAEGCAVRYWVVDNSGSMSTSDGKRFLSDPRRAGGLLTKVVCSRWEELSDTLRWVAGTAALLQARTEFRFLNPPRGAPQVIVVGSGGGDSAALAALERALASGPGGGTPLCAALGAVVDEVRGHASALRSSGMTAVVIVASDGEASDGDVGRALTPLSGLPASCVVRLCTDDDKVASYWNAVDADLEIELDVLDDLAGEGAEVHEHNPWVAYGEALHRAREWGGAPQVLDWLDERPLGKADAQSLIEHLLGPFEASLQLDPDSFLRELDDRLGGQADVFDADANRCRPWVDRQGLARHVLKRSMDVRDICSCAVS